MLFDRFVTVKVDDREFNIRRDLEKLGEFSSSLASVGLLDVIGGDTLTANELISSTSEDLDNIEKSFESLGDVEFLDLVLNTGVEYLANSKIIDQKWLGN